MTIRFVRFLIAVLLAMSQVVGSIPLQANACGPATECCHSRKAEPQHCCCRSKQSSATRSCCCHRTADQDQNDTHRRSMHRICGCGCQRTSQQEAPLSPVNDSSELNPRMCTSSLGEIVTNSSVAAFPAVRGSHESHVFYAELPQELLFCSWLI